MIEALIAGTLQGQPTEKTANSGRPFVTAQIRTLVAGGAELLVNVVTFSHSTSAALLSLASGDSVALTGTLNAKLWTDHQGITHPVLDLTANQAVMPYRRTSKRNASSNC
jgi:hypothetical protein